MINKTTLATFVVLVAVTLGLLTQTSAFQVESIQAHYIDLDQGVNDYGVS